MLLTITSIANLEVKTNQALPKLYETPLFVWKFPEEAYAQKYQRRNLKILLVKKSIKNKYEIYKNQTV